MSLNLLSNFQDVPMPASMSLDPIPGRYKFLMQGIAQEISKQGKPMIIVEMINMKALPAESPVTDEQAACAGLTVKYRIMVKEPSDPNIAMFHRELASVIRGLTTQYDDDPTSFPLFATFIQVAETVNAAVQEGAQIFVGCDVVHAENKKDPTRPFTNYRMLSLSSARKDYSGEFPVEEEDPV